MSNSRNIYAKQKAEFNKFNCRNRYNQQLSNYNTIVLSNKKAIDDECFKDLFQKTKSVSEYIVAKVSRKISATDCVNGVAGIIVGNRY